MSSVGSRGKGLGLRVVLPPRGISRLPPTIPQPLPVPPGTRMQQPTRSLPPNNGFTALRAPTLDEILLEDLERQNPPLGKGSSGRVYKVVHRKTGKAYALKIIRVEREENVRRQILTEMAILRKNNCDQIVKCFGAYDTMGEISFVLELMDAGSLADVIKATGRVPEQFIAEITRQVLTGLLYLHRQHVGHRDIKPSNLLINTSGQVKIADFGVSTMLQSTIAQCNSFVGTSAYLSPERINPSPHGDGRYNAYKSDIWSLGLTLLELYMGRYPYTEFQPGQVLPFFSLYNAIVRNDPPQAPPECSWNFQDFIAKCLTKEVASRPSVSDLIRHPFAAMYEEPQYQDLRAILPRQSG